MLARRVDPIWNTHNSHVSQLEGTSGGTSPLTPSGQRGTDERGRPLGLVIASKYTGKGPLVSVTLEFSLFTRSQQAATARKGTLGTHSFEASRFHAECSTILRRETVRALLVPCMQ